MAKAPRAGHSKTRLERELGEAGVASFWSACLRESGARLRIAARTADVDALAMTPTPEEAAAVRRLTRLPALAQVDPGLGAALLQVSELRASFTVAVSADVPTLPLDRLVEAVTAVRAGRSVLGPGPDGGYYLVGLPRGLSRRRRERAYLEAPMGTGGVLAHTRAALGEPVLLPPWPDVDSAAELRELARQLRGDPNLAPAVAAWLGDHGSGLEEAG
jgi:glycosyltransferase A (GT-A) superfamily protein (DUF2064 family)